MKGATKHCGTCKQCADRRRAFLQAGAPAELVDELPFLALILVVVVLLPCTVLFRQVCVGRIGVAAARESMFVKTAPDLPCDAALEESLRHVDGVVDV